MTNKTNTKDKIEQTALHLFAQKGFQSVSIRDICGEVGIKESTIYYYFKNKRAILDALLEKMNLLIEEMTNTFDHAFSIVQKVSEYAMCEVAVNYLKSYFLNPFVYQIIGILSIERMSDLHAAETYHRIVFEYPIKQQAKVFEQMIERGFICDSQVTVLAQEYSSIIYFAFEKNCVGCNVTEERKELAFKEIRANIKDFYHKIRRIS